MSYKAKEERLKVKGKPFKTVFPLAFFFDLFSFLFFSLSKKGTL